MAEDETGPHAQRCAKLTKIYHAVASAASGLVSSSGRTRAASNIPRFCAKCASTSLMCAWRLHEPACQHHQLL